MITNRIIHLFLKPCFFSLNNLGNSFIMALNRYTLFLQKGCRVFYSFTTMYLISLLLMEIKSF